MTDTHGVILVAVITVVVTVFINAIIAAVKMGALNKTVEANKDYAALSLKLHQESNANQISFIQRNQETITITVIELRKTNERLTRELDKLIGQLTPINRDNHG